MGKQYKIPLIFLVREADINKRYAKAFDSWFKGYDLKLKKRVYP